MTTIKHADDCEEYCGHWIRVETLPFSSRFAVTVDDEPLLMKGGKHRTPGSRRSFLTRRAALAAGRKQVRESQS